MTDIKMERNIRWTFYHFIVQRKGQSETRPTLISLVPTGTLFYSPDTTNKTKNTAPYDGPTLFGFYPTLKPPPKPHRTLES